MTDENTHNSSGQVNVQAKTSISYYAAARFAEQVSFGATPALIAEIQQLGFERWIDAQFALPATTGTMPRELMLVETEGAASTLAEEKLALFRADDFWSTAFTAPDQLRQRVAWAIFEYIPVNAGSANGPFEYYNMIRKNAFGNYADLLRSVSIHPMMGVYLNNDQNRPTSPECLGCTPNENYARELMQLFSIGVVQLNSDGTTIRDEKGKPKESYTQKDVEELARALTGWKSPPNTTGLPSQYWPHFNQPMVPESQDFLHDRGQKTLMGKFLKSGMAAPEELNAVVAILIEHPNIAPFVSLRLIQHLVMSDPSPQYLSRISAVFRDNGKGATGDLGSVVKAILLDPEAREADQINFANKRAGLLREPLLWQTAVFRGMGCKRTTHNNWNGIEYVDTTLQDPTSIPSVFSFYQATDRAPGSNLLAPGQKMLNTAVFTRLLETWTSRFADPNNPSYQDNLTKTGCNIGELVNAFKSSPSVFLDLVSKRWFRGAMPESLRSILQSLIREQPWSSPEQGAFNILSFALINPAFGVIK